MEPPRIKEICSNSRELVERSLTNGEEQWKSDDWRLVERRQNTWGAMDIKTQRSIYRERQ